MLYILRDVNYPNTHIFNQLLKKVQDFFNLNIKESVGFLQNVNNKTKKSNIFNRK